MKYVLETERLRLREFTFNDTGFIIELLNTPGWLQYIGDRNVKTEEQAKTYLENGPMKSYIENGFGLCLVERKEDDMPIGMCGIIKRNELELPDIGFAFLPEFNGKGYAYEIAAATLAYAKHTLKISKITAITLAENKNSIRLLEKVGFQFIEVICFGDEREKLMLYSN